MIFSIENTLSHQNSRQIILSQTQKNKQNRTEQNRTEEKERQKKIKREFKFYFYFFQIFTFPHNKTTQKKEKKKKRMETTRSCCWCASTKATMGLGTASSWKGSRRRFLSSSTRRDDSKKRRAKIIRNNTSSSSSEKHHHHNHHRVHALGSGTLQARPKMHEWPNGCTETRREDGSSVYRFFGGEQGSHAVVARVKISSADEGVEPSKVSKDTKTVDDEERRVKEITNSAIQATAKRSQEYCNTYAEEEMKKLVAEEKREDEKGMVSAKEEEEDDIQERLDAIIREHRKKQEDAAKASSTSSRPNLAIQCKNGGMSGMAAFYSAPGYAGFSWVSEEDIEMEDDDDDDDDDHSSNAITEVWGQKIGDNNTVFSTSGIAYKATPLSQSSSNIIAESVSREQTAQIKKAWKRVDARFDLPGPPNMWTRMDNEEKFLAVALSVATSIICYQNAPPVVRKPVQAASSSVKKLAHISRSTQPPPMPMTKKEKKAADKAATKKRNNKAKTASINQALGEISRSRKRAASVTPGDEVGSRQFLNIIRGDGSIDHTWRNVLFLVTFSFLSCIILKQFGLKQIFLNSIGASGVQDGKNTAEIKEIEIVAQLMKENDAKIEAVVAQLMKENDAKIEAVVAQVKYAKAERNAFKRLVENEMSKASAAASDTTFKSSSSLSSLSARKNANSDNKKLKQSYEKKIQKIKKDAEIAKHSFAFFKKEYIAKEAAMKKEFLEKEKKTALEVKQKTDDLSQQLKESQREFEKARKDAEIALKLALENNDNERLEKELEASKEALAKERDANRVAAQKKEEELLAKNKLAQAALQKQIKDLQVSLTAAKGSASKANAAKLAAVAKERDANRVAAQKKEEELLAKNKLAQAALQKQVADLQVSLTAEKDSASKANAAKTAALEENFKQRELAIMSEVEAAEAKVKEFERKNVQTVSEMKQQANKDIEEALASARAKFAKEKEVLTRKIDEERRQSRLEVEREKKRFREELKSKELALQQKNDKLIDEITLEFRREIKSRGPR